MTDKPKDFDTSHWDTFIEDVKPLPARPRTLPKVYKKKPKVLPQKEEIYVQRAPDSQTPQVRLDLHGYTEQTVFHVLEDFIIQCFKKNIRSILVITGKGTPQFVGQFLLRQEVPRFLQTPTMAKYVINIQPAPPNKGGEGALIVQLKNPRKVK